MWDDIYDTCWRFLLVVAFGSLFIHLIGWVMS